MTEEQQQPITILAAQSTVLTLPAMSPGKREAWEAEVKRLIRLRHPQAKAIELETISEIGNKRTEVGADRIMWSTWKGKTVRVVWRG